MSQAFKTKVRRQLGKERPPRQGPFKFVNLEDSACFGGHAFPDAFCKMARVLQDATAPQASSNRSKCSVLPPVCVPDSALAQHAGHDFAASDEPTHPLEH